MYVFIYLCMHVCIQLVFHAEYNISSDINMFQYFGEFISNTVQFMRDRWV